MSYDHRLLCRRISLSLLRNPSSSLQELSRELRVNRRTIQNAVHSVTGKTFRDLREQILLTRIKNLLASAPNSTIRKLSLKAGYRSPRAFARALQYRWDKKCRMDANLLDAILLRLRQTPCGLLRELCAELRVSRRTIENSVHLGTGKTFREVRKEILLDHVNRILAGNPAISVKELSFAVGFKSASSFSRAIKRACGFCPEELRSHAVRDPAVSISS